MEKLTYTNPRGQTIEFSQKPPYLLQFIDGMGGGDSEIQTQKSPYQDGSNLVDVLLDSKSLDITVAIRALDITQRRNYMLDVLNPKQGEGVLRYENDDTIRELRCVIGQAPSFPSGNDNRGPGFQRAFFSVFAPNPYWQSTEQITEPLAAFVNKFQFPFSFPVQFGERGAQVNLYNDGHVPCPVEIEFNGPAVNPIITNATTGEYILIKKELFDGEKLVINTSEGNERKIVIVDGEGNETSEWGYINPWESKLFYLDIGENIITYGASEGAANSVVNISFRKLYVGV